MRPLPTAARHEVFLGAAASGAFRKDVAFWSASLERHGAGAARAGSRRLKTLWVRAAAAAMMAVPVVVDGGVSSLQGSVDQAATAKVNRVTEIRTAPPPTLRSRRTQRYSAIGCERSSDHFSFSAWRSPEPRSRIFIGSNFANLDAGFCRDGRTAAAMGWFRRGGAWMNEARVSWQIENLGWNGPNAVLPEISIEEPEGLSLPGGAGSAFSYRSRVAEISDTFRASSGRHALSAGAGALLRFSVAHPVTEPTGAYFFKSIDDFVKGLATSYQLPGYRSWIPDSGAPDTRVPAVEPAVLRFPSGRISDFGAAQPQRRPSLGVVRNREDGTDVEQFSFWCFGSEPRGAASQRNGVRGCAAAARLFEPNRGAILLHGSAKQSAWLRTRSREGRLAFITTARMTICSNPEQRLLQPGSIRDDRVPADRGSE